MSMSCRYSNGDLWLAATMGLGTGILIGSFASPEPPSVLKTIRKRIFSVVGLGDFLDKMFSSKDANTGINSSSNSQIDENEAKNWKIAIIARSDIVAEPGTLATEAAITLLQHFKKLYKRRDSSLKLWEAGRHKMEFRTARTDDVLAAVQMTARGALIGTHTLSGRVPGISSQGGRDRRLMIVGPAESDRLHEIVGRLEEL